MALVNYLRSTDLSTVHNMDKLLLRLSMDVIGVNSLHHLYDTVLL